MREYEYNDYTITNIHDIDDRWRVSLRGGIISPLLVSEGEARGFARGHEAASAEVNRLKARVAELELERIGPKLHAYIPLNPPDADAMATRARGSHSVLTSMQEHESQEDFIPPRQMLRAALHELDHIAKMGGK